MSANPNNPGLELAKVPAKRSRASDADKGSQGRDALQALLAFSSLHEQLRQRRALEAETGKRLTADDPWQLEQFVLDDVLQLVAERAMSITGADGVAIAFAEGDAIVCRASVGKIVPDPGVRLDPNSAFSGACFRTGSVVRCDDAENDPRVSVQACRRLGALSIVAVPLPGRKSVLGLIEAFSTEVRSFDDSDIRTLKLLAELILAAIKPEEEDRLAEISLRVVAEGEQPKEPAGAAEKPTPAPADNLHHEREEAADENVLAAVETTDKRSISPAFVAVLLVLVAALTGGLLWFKMHGRTVTVATSPAQPANNTGNTPSSAAPDKESATTMTGPVAPYKPSGETGTVTGLRHWSSQESSTVVIDLQKPVQYEAHRISNPDRIYFDLDDTSMAASLFGKIVDINDTFLQRVRIAQPTSGVTRVVLETKSTPDFSVSLEQNPYRLVVEVRKAGSQPPSRTKVDLFGPPQTGQTVEAQNIAPAPETQESPHAKFRIVLDAGHGGWDLGTVGRSGLLEKDLVLDIVGRLGKLVENRLGGEVIYTRTDDTYISLEKRAEIANLAHADLFLSVHANYSDLPSARGVETYYTNTYSSVHARTQDAEGDAALTSVDWTNVDIREKVRESKKLAETIQHALYGTLSGQNPGLRDRGVKEASYVVLTGTTMPAVLSEVSFISSPADERNLENAEYRQKIALALYKGVERYADASRHDQIAGLQGKSAAR